MPKAVFTIAAVLLIALHSGCGPSLTPRAPSAAQFEISSEPSEKPLRLASEQLARLRTTQRSPLTVPLDQAWRPLSGCRVERGKDTLRLEIGRTNRHIVRDVQIDAALYNELHVRMRVDKGAQCTFKWASDLEPLMARNTGVSVPILADDQFHTYRLPLTLVWDVFWAGQISAISFSPSDVAAQAEIASFEFVFVPPEAPQRLTIQQQTHEALFGTQPPWEITVPPEAAFVVHFGMSRHSWENRHAGAWARFVVTLEEPSKREVVLADKVLQPIKVGQDRDWQQVQADLSPFAGEKVRIHLIVDNLGSAEGDYTFWGKPMVYSRKVDAGDIPVVLISCDAVRADHLSCYGYYRETTPHLDQWAKDEAVLFENAFTQASWTLHSHATMFTGLYPKNHGVTAGTNLAEATVTLPEALRDAGYLTAGFTGFKWWLQPWRGFSHGSDLYNIPYYAVRDVFTTHELVMNWLDSHGIPRVFLFAHNFDAHAKFDKDSWPGKHIQGLPYGPSKPEFLHFSKALGAPPSFQREEDPIFSHDLFVLAMSRGEIELTPEERAYTVALYDDSVRSLDRALFDFFEDLKGRGLYHNALIIVTADHGEGLGDHGIYGHGQVYEECARVPLLIKFPQGRFAGSRFSGLVQLVDLYPTVLEVLGLSPREPVDGKSLLAMLEGREQPHERAYTQRLAYQAVRTKEWKLIYNTENNTYELYHLATDPYERNNLFEQAPEPLPALTKALHEFFSVKPEGWHLAWHNPTPGRKIEIAVVTDDRFETTGLLLGDRQDGDTPFSRESRVLKGSLGELTHEEILLLTASSKGRLFLTLSSETDCSLRLGNDPPDKGKMFQIVLDPLERTYPKPATTPGPAPTVPTLTVWYVKPAVSRTAAKELSPEAIQELKALGYVE